MRSSQYWVQYLYSSHSWCCTSYGAECRNPVQATASFSFLSVIDLCVLQPLVRKSKYTPPLHSLQIISMLVGIKIAFNALFLEIVTKIKHFVLTLTNKCKSRLSVYQHHLWSISAQPLWRHLYPRQNKKRGKSRLRRAQWIFNRHGRHLYFLLLRKPSTAA